MMGVTSFCSYVTEERDKRMSQDKEGEQVLEKLGLQHSITTSGPRARTVNTNDDDDDDDGNY